MKRVSQLLMAAGLFAFGAYNVLVFQEIRVISRFCGNQYKETQESPPTFESVVMFAHDIAKNNQIHPPLLQASPVWANTSDQNLMRIVETLANWPPR